MRSSSLFTVAWLASVCRTQAPCVLPLDVMFLQDTTGSFDDDLPNVLDQIPEMVQTISNYYPNSRFGVAEFKDKPFDPLGEPADFCYKLANGALSDSMDRFRQAYALLVATGGNDLPEASYQALIDVALDPAVGWRSLSAGEVGARVVIMSTDAIAHTVGDISRIDAVRFPDLPRDLPPNSGRISTDDVNFECLEQDYPSAEQVRDVLKERDIYLVILTPEDEAIVPFWTAFNQDTLNQPASFYRFISNDSSDLLDGVLQTVQAVAQAVCFPDSSTTTQPTTTTITTTPTTTTLPTTTPPVTTTTLTTTTPPVTTTILSSTARTEPSTRSSTDLLTSSGSDASMSRSQKDCRDEMVVRLADRPARLNLTMTQ